MNIQKKLDELDIEKQKAIKNGDKLKELQIKCAMHKLLNYTERGKM